MGERGRNEVGVTVFLHLTTKFGSNGVSLNGVADMELLNILGQWTLYSASQTDYSLGAFQIGNSGGLSQLDGVGYAASSGTLGVHGLSVLQVGAQLGLIPRSSFEDKLAIHDLNINGSFGNVAPPVNSIANEMARLSATTSIRIDGIDYAYFANSENAGFKGYEVSNNLDLTEITARNDNQKSHLGDVTDLLALEAYGKNFIFATSAEDAGVSSYRLDKFGRTYSKHNTGPEDGIGMSGTTAMVSVETEGDVFLIVAGAGSNSLTSFRISKQGVLREKDHIVDTGDTRFETVSALEAVQINDRSFVLAGGNDDGITLFELTPRSGKLKLWGVLEDSNATTLASVSDIEALEVDGELHLYVTSAYENGITHLKADVGTLASPIVGTKNAEVFDGSANDDLILGMNGDDTLRGNAGDDWLIDGRGMDLLEGGIGADVFCFAVDRKTDTIVDFTPGVDRIDLSEIPMLYSLEQTTIVQKDFGVVVSFGSERVKILSNDLGGDIMVADINSNDFIFN